MELKKEVHINTFGMVVLGLLFFLLLSSFSDKPVKRDGEALKIEFVAELHLAASQEDATHSIQIPLFRQNWISSIDRMNIRLFSYALHLFSENSLLRQKIFYLDKAYLLIKILIFQPFYFHLSSFESRELPVLN